MILNTEREQVRGVAAMWRKQYPRPEMLFGGVSTALVQQRLDALDAKTATGIDVAAIVGNNAWVEPHTCDECGQDSWDTIELGEEPDDESRTATVCLECLRKAIALLEASR